MTEPNRTDAARPAGAGGAVRGDDESDVEQHADRAERLQERLAIPVLIAALASVPAVFLTLFDDPAESIGSVINTLSGAVLIAEAVVLLAVSENRLQWLRDNLWLVGLALLMIPAIIFAVGPVQLLRLVRLVGALRIIRVRRILKAGKIVRRRAGLDQLWQRAISVGISLLVAGFVAVVLADPTSQSRQLMEDMLGLSGPVPAIVAGVLLGGATLIVALNRGEDEEDLDGEEADEVEAGSDPAADEVEAGRDRAADD